MVKKKKQSYDASSIDVLEGLEIIRTKPSMYIGATNSEGIFHLFKEVVANSVDEAMNGYGEYIDVYIEDDTVTVADQGRGIPCGPHPKKKKDTLELIATELHSGGKLKKGQTGYNSSGGTHGIGLSAVNALSAQLQVWTFRKDRGGWHTQSYKKGVPTGPVKKCKKPEHARGNKGTVIRWKHDASLFHKGAKLKEKEVMPYLDMLTYFTGGVEYFLQTSDGAEDSICREGVEDYYTEYLEELGVETLEGPFTLEDDSVNITFGWTETSDEVLDYFCSAVPTAEGGTHSNGFNLAVRDALGEYSLQKDIYTTDDLRAGVVGLVNVKVASPEFTSQTKEKLSSPEAKSLVYDATYSLLMDNLTKASARRIIDRANELRRAQNDLSIGKDLAKKLESKKGGKTIMPKGFIACTEKDPEKRELFIVEGDSAGGSAERARDASYQEVFKLGGKPPQIWKGKPEKTLENSSVVDMLKAIGWHPEKDSIRAGRIILLADQDVDGFHITSLLLALLWKVKPSFFSEGKVFTVDAPLYSYALKEGKVYGKTLAELKANLPKGTKYDASKATRFKGWGEAEYTDLADIAFNSKRKLIRVAPPKKNEVEDMLGCWNENVDARKKLLGID